MTQSASEKQNQSSSEIHDEKRSQPLFDLYADESVSDLARDGLRLIQPMAGFRFGEDTVLLADYAARLYDGQKNRLLRIADLGAGSGAGTILLSARLTAASFLAIELDSHSLSTLERNAKINGLSDRVTILDTDYSHWAEAPPQLPNGTAFSGTCDLVIANPPYGLPTEGHPTDDRRRMAREELSMTMDSLMQAARYLLRPRGRLVLIHRTSRLTDVLVRMRRYQIEPKQLRLIMSVEGRPPARFLLTGVQQARPGSLMVPAPLLIRDLQHHLTDEAQCIYRNDPLLPEDVLYEGLMKIGKDWSEAAGKPGHTCLSEDSP